MKKGHLLTVCACTNLRCIVVGKICPYVEDAELKLRVPETARDMLVMLVDFSCLEEDKVIVIVWVRGGGEGRATTLSFESAQDGSDYPEIV